MALQALAEYAILSHAGSVNLTISLASTNLDYQETFELHRANQKVLQTAAVCIPGPDVGGPTRCPPTPVCLRRASRCPRSYRSPASPRGCS